MTMRAIFALALLLAACGGQVAPPAPDAACRLEPTESGALFDFDLACPDGGDGATP